MLSLAIFEPAIAGPKDMKTILAGDISQDSSLEDTPEDVGSRKLHEAVSMDDMIKLRRDLDLYSRTVDPSNIQLEERRRLMRKRIQERFMSADTDGDGTLSRIEATESLPQIARHFSKVDLNSDELITINELATAYDNSIEKQRLEAQRVFEMEQAEQRKAAELAAKPKSKQAESARKRSL